MTFHIQAHTIDNVAGRDIFISSPGSTGARSERTVLFVASDPRNVTALRVMEELREVEYALQMASVTDHVRIEAVPSARPGDLQAALLRYRPEIVHLAGHGVGAEIMLEDDHGQPALIGPSWINTMLCGSDAHCVVLNVCRSEETARQIAGVPTRIGWDGDVEDALAIIFASAFYTAIGYGHPYVRAFEQAKAFVYGDVQPVLIQS